MNRQRVRIHLAIASMLALVLVALTVAPAGAATVTRRTYAEDLAFHLTNCLRTGGWVTKDGNCMAYGKGKFSKYVKPLKRSKKISNKVALPWARKSVQWGGTTRCWIGHERYGSTVKSRFRAVGLTGKAGENMGCGFWGGPQQNIIRIVRMWQAERKYNGWHWRLLKSTDWRSAGVAVTRYGKKTQLVFNFYQWSPY